MSLPKLLTPKFEVKLPSSGKEISFRPFLVKEEKALLIARESEDSKVMAQAMYDVLYACLEGSISENEIRNLPYFDVEYLFINIRAKSVGEISKFEYKHSGGKNRKGEPCEVVTPIEVNLEDVKVEFDPKHERKIMINEKLGIEMKYPTLKTIQAAMSQKDPDLEVLASCIESVFDTEGNVFTPDNNEDAIEFIKSMDTKQFMKLSAFFETMPKIKHLVTYKCNGCGQEDKVLFEGIADFF